MKSLSRDLVGVEGVAVHPIQREPQRNWQSIAITVGRSDENRNRMVKALSQRHELVVDVGGALELPKEFNHIAALEKVLNLIESAGKASWVETIIIDGDVIDLEGYDRLKKLFSEFELSKKENTITFTTNQQQPIAWTTRTVREGLSTSPSSPAIGTLS